MTGKTLLTLFFLTGATVSFSQVSLQVSRVSPAGTFGYYFKPATSVEVGFCGYEVEDRLRIGASIGFFRLKSWRDTFSNYAIQSGQNGYTLHPGYEIWKSYHVTTLSLFLDVKILDKRLSPVAGIETGAYFTGYHYESYVQGIRSLTETGGDGFVFVLPRLGLSYGVNDQLLLSSGLGRNMALKVGGGSQSFNKFYFQAFYYFN